MARPRIKKSAGTLSGAGLALGGLITGYLSVALFACAALFASFAIPRANLPRPMPRMAPVAPVAPNDDCVANLKSIQAAKTAWAIELKKQPTDAPTDTDLFGTDKYLRQKPSCPGGGVYRLNPVSEKPTCSVPGHAY
jgi:hypothetical protein